MHPQTSRGHVASARLVRAWLVVGLVLATAAGCGPAAVGPEASRPAATPAERYALGAASDYPGTARSDAEAAAARTSIAARRALGWRVASQALEPVAVAGGTVPRFLTWYAKDDLNRMLRHAYEGLGKDGRRARAPIGPDALDAAEAWSATMARTLPSWPPERLDAWLATLGDDTTRHGLAGLRRTLFSPAAMRHLVGEYTGVAACPDTADAAAPDTPGRAEDNFTLCFDHEMPAGAALVKTAWRRADFNMTLPTYDTGAAAMASRLASLDGAWGTGDGTARPGADAIFTMRNEAGSTFRLAGLHVMTKEQREWVWVSLWWSPKPDAGLGEDRPTAMANGHAWGAWANYEMCVVTAFDETAEVDADLRARHPSLAGTMQSVMDATRPHSWCSNPYIEEGTRNHASNCIGCHQHGGTRLASEAVLADEARFPGAGRARARESFPADYLWSLSRTPEEISGDVAELIRYYDVYDQHNGRSLHGVP